MRAFLFLFLLALTFSTGVFALEVVPAEFQPVFRIGRGTGPGQLLWLTAENGGILDGPFQGPMAFLTDTKGNLWVGDTLNARLTAFDRQGKQRQEIDLIAAARQAGLASDPVLLDFVPGSDGRLLVADAANNAILAVGRQGEPARAFRSAGDRDAGWSQINRIHTDQAGRMYIEDVAAMKTVILTAAGQAFCEALDGDVGLAVAPDGTAAMVVNDSQAADRRYVVLAPAPGEPFIRIADLRADEPILWSGVVGFDKNQFLTVVFDTASARHFVTLAGSGGIQAHRIVALPDPGYDPARPEWIGADGELYMVKAETDVLQVLRLK